MPFTHIERVRFGDLDAMRHLNNVVYLRYFESARIAFLRTLIPEHTPDNPERDDFGLIFAEGHINYRSPVTFDEEVAVTCTVDEVRRSAFKVPFQMHVGERLAAEGYGWLVGFDYTTQKAAPLPDELKQALIEAGGRPVELDPEDQHDEHRGERRRHERILPAADPQADPEPVDGQPQRADLHPQGHEAERNPSAGRNRCNPHDHPALCRVNASSDCARRPPLRPEWPP